MKLNTAVAQLETTGLQERKSFTVDTNSSKLFDILQDTLYTDKILAPVREYLCNALDAHNMIDQTRPFDVYVPNTNVPEWAVRDYGPGLSHDDVMNVYTVYLRSTKDDSDDLIGGFGIGCKSGFAYTDQFTVISYFNGEKSRYAMFKNEFRKPDIALVDRTPTDEPNGIEIRIPVRNEDFNSFENKTKDVLQYFSDGSAEPFNFVVPKLEYVYETPEFVLPVQKSMYHIQHSILMGNVRYAIPNALAEHPLLQQLTKARQDIILIAPIGACSLSPSREALSLDKKTEAWLRDSLDKALESIKTYAQASLTDAERDLVSYGRAVIALDGFAKEFIPKPSDSPYPVAYHYYRDRYMLSSFALEEVGFTLHLAKGPQGGPAKRFYAKDFGYIDCASIFAIPPKHGKNNVTLNEKARELAEFFNQIPGRRGMSGGPPVVMGSPELFKALNIEPDFDFSDHKPTPRAKSTAKKPTSFLKWRGSYSRRERCTVAQLKSPYYNYTYVYVTEAENDNLWFSSVINIPKDITGYDNLCFIFVPSNHQTYFCSEFPTAISNKQLIANVEKNLTMQIDRCAGALARKDFPDLSEVMAKSFFDLKINSDFWYGKQWGELQLVQANCRQIKDAVESIRQKAKDRYESQYKPLLEGPAKTLKDNPKLATLLKDAGLHNMNYIKQLWNKANKP